MRVVYRAAKSRQSPVATSAFYDVSLSFWAPARNYRLFADFHGF